MQLRLKLSNASVQLVDAEYSTLEILSLNMITKKLKCWLVEWNQSAFKKADQCLKLNADWSRARANESTPSSGAQNWILIRTSPALAGEGRSFWPSWVKSSVGSVCQTLGCYCQQWWQTASSVENDCFPSHVMENSHFLHCWLFVITAVSSNLVFNKQIQQCICQQSWSRKWAKN